MTQEEAYVHLDEIYKRIPEVNCKGKCLEFCGPIMAESFELERINHPLSLGKDLRCPLLKKGRCTVYSKRPAICRLFGAVNHPLLTCPYGCKAKKPLEEHESRAILAEIEMLNRMIEE